MADVDDRAVSLEPKSIATCRFVNGLPGQIAKTLWPG